MSGNKPGYRIWETAYPHLQKSKTDSPDNDGTKETTQSTKRTVELITDIEKIRKLIWMVLPWMKTKVVKVGQITMLGWKIAAELFFENGLSCCYYVDFDKNQHRQVEIYSYKNSYKRLPVLKMWGAGNIGNRKMIHILTSEWSFCIYSDKIVYVTSPDPKFDDKKNPVTRYFPHGNNVHHERVVPPGYCFQS